MKVAEVIQQLRDMFRRKPEIPAAPIEWMIGSLERTVEEEISCDEVFRLLDEYAESERRGEDVSHIMPLLKQHFDICRECCEEHDALLSVLEDSPEGPPSPS